MWCRHVLRTQAASHSGLAIRTTTNPNITIPLTSLIIWHHFTNDWSHSRLYCARSALHRYSRICPSQGRPSRPARDSGAAAPDDQPRSNLNARLGVRRPIAVDILLTIRGIVKLKGMYDEQSREQRRTRRRNGQ
jgi:hypothetical protein